MEYFWGDLLDSRFYVAHLISKKSCNTIVDVGCGAGVLLHYANSKFKIGLDLSFESLLAAKNLGGELELIQADSRFLPLKSNNFDNILAIHIISALNKKNDQNLIMDEIQRIASTRSNVIIAGANRLSKHFKKIYSKEKNSNYLSHQDIVNYYNNSFESITAEGYGPFSKKQMKFLSGIYKIPEKLSEILKIENIIFNILKSKNYLTDGRSYIIICKNKKFLGKNNTKKFGYVKNES